jgi:hypothetical protein
VPPRVGKRAVSSVGGGRNPLFAFIPNLTSAGDGDSGDRSTSGYQG